MSTNPRTQIVPGEPLLLGIITAEPTVPAGAIAIYGKEVSGKIETFFKTFNTDEIQISSDGTIIGASGGSTQALTTGAAVPDDGDGVDGDFYFRDNGDFYQKLSGSWGSSLGNLQGPAGTTGATGAPGNDGNDGSNGSAGVDGDDGVGVPAGGSDTQVLAKASGADYDTEWVDAASGGGGLREEYKISLGAGADIDAKVANGASVIPVGWSIVDALDASVHAQLQAGGTVDDIVFIHATGLRAMIIAVSRVDPFGGEINVDSTGSADIKNEAASFNQCRLRDFNTNVGNAASTIYIKLI